MVEWSVGEKEGQQAVLKAVQRVGRMAATMVE
jgi:hypothetical protein